MKDWWSSSALVREIKPVKKTVDSSGGTQSEDCQMGRLHP